MPKSFGKIWVVLKRTNSFVVVVEREEKPPAIYVLAASFLAAGFSAAVLAELLAAFFAAGFLTAFLTAGFLAAGFKNHVFS